MKLPDGTEVNPDEIESEPLSPEQRLYKENILDHYRNPRNKKIVEGGLHAHDKNPFCGDELEVYVIVEKGRVADIGFQGNGCAISQASMSMLTRKLRGKTLEEIQKLDQEFILDMLNIPIGIVRRKCAMLGLRVTQQALEAQNA